MSTIYAVNYKGQNALIVIGGGPILLLDIGVGVSPIYRTFKEPCLDQLDILKWGVLVEALSNGSEQLFNRVQLLARLLCQ